jgi:glutamyl/glutaminyl-tRNA synthetase
MTSEKLKLFETEEKKPNYKIKETGETVSFEFLQKIVLIYQERLKKLSEITELTDFFFKEKLNYDKSLLKWNDMTEKEISQSLGESEKILSKIKNEDWKKENIEKILLEETEKTGDRGKLLWPLRVALSGKQASAGPFDIAYLLGKEKTLKRLKEAK